MQTREEKYSAAVERNIANAERIVRSGHGRSTYTHNMLGIRATDTQHDDRIARLNDQIRVKHF